jgi:hypothetical protein
MAVTLSGYQSFITNYLQIPTSALPLSSPSILMTLAIAEEVVNPALMVVSSPCESTLGYTGDNVYELAVYNLAADYLINFAPDQPGQTYFADLREKWKIFNFVPGVISASSDETTSESILNPEFMKGFTMSDLQRAKTPYGRQYLMFAQQYGQLWGLS